MPRLRIAPRWLGEPLWVMDENGRAEAVDIDDLDLSEDLADRIEAWVDAFDATYDATDPSRSGFQDRGAEDGWRSEATALATELREELGEAWIIELDLGSEK